MTVNILFDEARMAEIENTPFTGVMTPEQEKIMGLVTMVISNKLSSIKPLVVKGIFRLSIKSWMGSSGIDPRILITQQVDEVAHHIKEIVDIIGGKLESILRNPEDKKKLSDLMEEVYNTIIMKRREMEK